MQEHQADVIARAVAAEPHHGEIWQRIAKDDRNRRKSTKDILELVIAALR
jgi:pre-mRNA-processing factor 6